MYAIYHVERLENAFDDIDSLIKEKSIGLVSYSNSGQGWSVDI